MIGYWKMPQKKMIKDNLNKIQEDIDKALKNSKYSQDVTLVAVSKTHTASDILAAYDSGIRDFGENKVQELLSKVDVLPQDIRWHLIGHLQTNKVKSIIGKVYLIHSVDSIKLAQIIENYAAKANVTVNILIQVNISHEESKFGIDRSELADMLWQISAMHHINVLGLMTIAPETDNAENCRHVFQELKELSIDIDSMNIDNIRMQILSMGMSGDFKVAIEEGSTMVRIGTSIFGARQYANKSVGNNKE